MPDSQAQRKAKRIKNKLDKLSEDFRLACIEAFPKGAEARYVHGDRLRFVSVVDHGYGTRIKVMGQETGREYWIDAYRLLEDVDA